MKTITIYTDGACSGNPGPGGWGAILQYGPHTREMSGGEADTTNNRMELTGVIRALQALKEPCIVELYSDSKYVIDALSKGWARSWRAKGWVKSDKKPALNPDLWELLLDLCQVHQVRTHWVKGHAENPSTHRCDQLAVSEWQKLKRQTGGGRRPSACRLERGKSAPGRRSCRPGGRPCPARCEKRLGVRRGAQTFPVKAC